MKYLSIEHNINLMNKFYDQEAFAGLLETARSEKQWKNLRTYISIFGEYSTYMTEKQKLMTMRFLSELLVRRESDIRNQAGAIIGQIIAHFNEEYRKGAACREVDSSLHKDVTNESLWKDLLARSSCLTTGSRISTKKMDRKQSQEHSPGVAHQLSA